MLLSFCWGMGRRSNVSGKGCMKIHFLTWAVSNLVMTILVALVAIIIVVRWIAGRNTETERYNYFVRNSFLRILSLVVLVQSIAMFLMFEDMSRPMGLFNRLTPFHACLLLAQIILAFIMRGRRKADKDEV